MKSFQKKTQQLLLVKTQTSRMIMISEISESKSA